MRLSTWDYGWNAAYFITICTAEREHFFGEVVEGEMQLSPAGYLAARYWKEIPIHFPFITLDVFVTMPNHVHGILIIDKTDSNSSTSDRNSTCGGGSGSSGGAINRAATEENLKMKANPGGVTGLKNPMLHDNLSRVIRWYKGRCTFEIRKVDSAFRWQSRFYDHIIRNQNSFQQIQQYILKNPRCWVQDKFY